VRTPSSASLEYAKLKTEKAAELARTIKETKATNSTVFAGGGRVYVDIGKPKTRDRTIWEISKELRAKVASIVGAEYVVIDDLNQGVRKPVQIQFTGPDYRRLMAITNTYMDQVRKIPGAVDVGLSEQEPKDELKIELDRGLASSLGISVGDAAQALRVAFAGLEVGDWFKHVGECADDLAVVRSLWTIHNDHGTQLTWHTGRHPREGSFPTIGSWVNPRDSSVTFRNPLLPKTVIQPAARTALPTNSGSTMAMISRCLKRLWLRATT